MKNILIALILAVVCIIGCERTEADTKGAQPPQVVVQMPNGEEIVIHQEEIIPAETHSSTKYEATGQTYDRKQEHARVLSPWGVSPGESLSKIAPAQIGVSQQPGVNITPAGVSATPTETGKTQVGGAQKWTIFDTIKGWFNGIFNWLIIIGIVVAALWIWPVTRPFVTAAFKWIASMLPIVGGWIAGIWKKTATQVVYGGQKFEEVIATKDTWTKDEVLKAFADSHYAEVDENTLVRVNRIKGS